jgi:outer membrane protein insertion porin family
LVIYVKEKPTIQTIDYTGLDAITVSDIDEQLKKAKVGMTVESQYDPTRIKRAEVVLKDLESEHGHQFATVRTEVKTIPPASVGITFRIKEGPTVKVGKIAFDGNYSVSDRVLRNAMVNTKPIGIPHSIIFENLFARTFDASKLDDDTLRVQRAYADRGYVAAETSDPQTHVRDEGGLNWFTLRPSTGKRIDILMPVEEGERYRLGGITFTGNKAVSDIRQLRGQFAQKDGEWFNMTMFAKEASASSTWWQTRSRGEMKRRSWSIGTSISMRTSSSSSHASSLPAIRSPETRSSDASCCWRRASSTAASFGISLSCA